MKKLLSTLACVILLSTLAACTNLQGQNVYEGNEIGKASDIEFGKIVSVKQIEVKGENSGVGGIAGATAGGAAGAQVGNGGGSIAGLIAGAIIGGVAGSMAEQAMKDRVGLLYVITKENGKTVSIAQNIAKDDVPLKVGQRVMIQTSGEYQRAASTARSGEQYQRVLPVD